MKRKLLSVLLTLCLAFSLLPTAALADGEGGQTKDVAQTNGTGYETLQAAIDAAAKKATVTLLANTKENVTISTYGVTLDLNGFTLNGSTGKREPALTVNNTRVTIMDSSEAQTGTIMREDTAENSGVSSHYVIDVQGKNGFLLFKSGTVTNGSGAGGTNGASLVRIGTDDQPTWKPQLTIEGGTFTQDNFIVLKVGGYGTLYVKGGTINSKNSYAVENWSFAVIKDQAVVNGKVSSWTYQNSLKKNELEIRGGTVNGDVTSVNYGDANKVAKVAITGGTVTGDLDTRSYDPTTGKLTSINDAAKSTIEVTGGSFDKDPSKYVTEDAKTEKNGDGSFGVSKVYLCKIGDTGYYTMDEAFKAQTASREPIVLLRDYTTGSTFNSGDASRVVDLNNHTWTCTGKDANSAAFAINYPNAALTVKNGKIVSSQLVGLIPSASSLTGPITYDNSSLTFENVEMTTTATSGIETNGNNTNDSVTLRNSTLNVPNGFGIYFPSSGTLTIDNSTISAKTMGVQVCAGSLNINDGSKITVNGDAVPKTESDGAIQDGAAISIVNRDGYKGLGKIEVTGGTFKANGNNAAIKAYGWNNTNKKEDTFTESDKVSVSGGTFSSEVKSEYCADGFAPKANSDGTYGVKINENMVAEVLDAQGNTVGAYDTLADAITAVKDGETITLLKDAELTSTLNLAKNITIDGQGNYTIKAANNFTVGKDKDNKTCCVLYVSGEVTLKDVTVNGNEKCRVIFCDKGKLTIDGATITNGKAPNYIGGVYMTSSASFEMKSGSITGNKNAEGYQDDKYLQYSSDLWIGANANGALTAINGGTIGNVFVNANAWSASNPGSFTMNGGTVTNLYVEHDANYGATFKYNDGTIEHLYLSKENGNGQSIEVTPVKGVIYNGGVKEKDLVTLTMKYNDGATADSTYNVASGTTITLPTPKRSGYTFNGWYDGSTKVSSPYEVTKNVTLTASWSYISSGSSSYDPTYSVSTPSKTEHGSVTVSPKNASKGDRVTVTVKPDSGYVLETLTVTDKNGNELTLKDKGNGKYTFTMPAGKVEVKATFMEDNSMLNFFYDVPNDAYFYEAVKWAVKNGITTGVGNNLFAPEQPCTRAQIVTFLWRAAGSPEPKGAASGMTDVVSGSYYEKAVAWAIENGITTGTTTSTFSPDATCTRAQAVTFLARALNAKAASAAEFSDVPTDSYFADAVAWAAANGVTEGIGGGLFGSDNDCTRGQIVTFLYRAYNK